MGSHNMVECLAQMAAFDIVRISKVNLSAFI